MLFYQRRDHSRHSDQRPVYLTHTQYTHYHITIILLVCGTHHQHHVNSVRELDVNFLRRCKSAPPYYVVTLTHEFLNLKSIGFNTLSKCCAKFQVIIIIITRRVRPAVAAMLPQTMQYVNALSPPWGTGGG